MSNQFSEIRIRKHFLPLESIEENKKEIIVIDLFKKESIIKNYVKMLQYVKLGQMSLWLSVVRRTIRK